VLAHSAEHNDVVPEFVENELNAGFPSICVDLPAPSIPEKLTIFNFLLAIG
jgi:hypothetical protein